MRCKACDTVWLVSGPSTGALPNVEESMPSSTHYDQFDQSPYSARGGHAAVVRTGAEREKRDLFATRPPDMGSVKQTLLPPPSTANPALGGNGTAARNENSVLFTLDALPGNARVKTPEPSPARSDYGGPVASVRPLSEDDEGIIDLKALSTAPPRASNRPMVAPLFPSEPPPAAFARDASGEQAPVKRGGKIAMFATAAVVLVLSGVGLAVAFRGEEAVPRAAATAAPAPPPPPPAATPTPAPSNDPPPAASSSSASDDSKDPKKKGGKHHAGGGKHHAGAGGAHTGPITDKTPPPEKKPVKPADPCGCHGDFNCILACTVNKK